MAATTLLQVCGASGASRAAAAALDEEADAIARAVKRALPFVGKRAVPVAPQPFAAAVALDELAGLAGPTHALVLKCASGARGLVAFDGRALALMLDGVLGGDGTAVPALRPGALTPPQSALAARMADAVARAVAERTNARFGLTLRPEPSERPASLASLTLLVARVELGAADAGTILLALPRNVADLRAGAFRGRDPAVAAVLSEVEVEVCVELGTMHVPLARLLALEPGDTLLSDIPISSAVVVRSDDVKLFEGRPTNAGGSFAVRIERRHAT